MLMKKLILTGLVALSLTTSPVWADKLFILDDYQQLKVSDIKTAGLVLKDMREAVFYAQGPEDGAVICASPLPITKTRLIEMFEAEIAKPTNAQGRKYHSDDQAAFVFVHALKKEKVCK
jgi:hypothetical protein